MAGLFHLLKASPSRAEEVLEHALDAIFSLDSKHLVNFFNRAAERLWGYRKSEVLGKHVNMLLPTEFAENLDEFMQRNHVTGQGQIVSTSQDMPLETKDGQQLWVNLSLSKISSRNKATYTAFVKDISVQRHTQAIMEQTLEQAIDGVVTIDEQNNVTFFNGSAERLWGYSREEVLGKNVKMLVPSEIQSDHDAYVNTNRETGIDKIVGTSREVPIQRKDGTRLFGSLALSKIEVEGSILYTAFLKDTTQEVQNQQQLRLLSLVADGTENSVTITDANGLIEYVNPGFEKNDGLFF